MSSATERPQELFGGGTQSLVCTSMVLFKVDGACAGFVRMAKALASAPAVDAGAKPAPIAKGSIGVPSSGGVARQATAVVVIAQALQAASCAFGRWALFGRPPAPRAIAADGPTMKPRPPTMKPRPPTREGRAASAARASRRPLRRDEFRDKPPLSRNSRTCPLRDCARRRKGCPKLGRGGRDSRGAGGVLGPVLAAVRRPSSFGTRPPKQL